MNKLSLVAGAMLASAVATAAAAQTTDWAGPYAGVETGESSAAPYGYYHGYYYNLGNGGATGGSGTSTTTGGTTSGSGAGAYTPPGTTATPPTAGATPAGYISYNIDKSFQDFTIAGFAGYNMQRGRWVYGLEGDYGDVAGSGGAMVVDPGGSGRYDIVRIDSGGHLRARFGYDVQGWLPYFTGGAVFDDVYAAHFGVSPASNGVAQLFTQANMRVGWSVGLGFDRQFAGGWILRGEYSRDYLGRYTNQWVPNQLFSYESFNVDVVRVGLAKRF